MRGDPGPTPTLPRACRAQLFLATIPFARHTLGHGADRCVQNSTPERQMKRLRQFGAGVRLRNRPCELQVGEPLDAFIALIVADNDKGDLF
jgi:hypothetical protein